MRTPERPIHTIAFSLATALTAVGFCGCAAWAFGQLGPVEQHVVSLVASPWLDSPLAPPPARHDAAMASSARCVPPDWAQ